MADHVSDGFLMIVLVTYTASKSFKSECHSQCVWSRRYKGPWQTLKFKWFTYFHRFFKDVLEFLAGLSLVATNRMFSFKGKTSLTWFTSNWIPHKKGTFPDALHFEVTLNF